MEFGLKITFCLLVATAAVTVQGSDLPDSPFDNDPHRAPAGNRPKRWTGLSVFDQLRGNGASGAKPTKATARDPKPAPAAGGNGFGFNLEDALRPAVKPTEKPSGGDCEGNMVQKLGTVIEKQNQQLRLLAQLLAQSSSPRYNPRHMR